MKKMARKVLSVLLSLELVLSLLPGGSLTAYANGDGAYSSYVGTTTTVKFNGIDWYIIEDNSTSAMEGSVRLLAKERVGTSQFNANRDDGNSYEGSLLKTWVETYYTNTFGDLPSGVVIDGKLDILTKDEASQLSQDVLKCASDSILNNMWWLSSPGGATDCALIVRCGTGVISDYGQYVNQTVAVRPALQLDLSKVSFDEETKTFALPFPLYVGETQVTNANAANIPGGETATASYNADTNTLTLNGYSPETATTHDYTLYYTTYHCGICYTGTSPLNIVLTGTNKIDVYVSNTEPSYGIFSASADITFSGTGSLTVAAREAGVYGMADITINGGTITATAMASGSCYAIRAGKDITITEGTVNTTGDGGEWGFGYGICASSDGGNIAITGGTVTATGKGYQGDGIKAATSITISNGTVTAKSESSHKYSNSYGIRAEAYEGGAYVAISGGSVTAIGDGEKGFSIKGTVKNTIKGTGWTDSEGAEGRANIPVSEEGQSLTSYNYKRVQFPAAHTHEFSNYTLSAGGATITAVCEAADCDLTDSTATLTIAAPTEGGGAASVTDEAGMRGEAKVTYQTKDGATWSEPTEEVPSGNGFYKASLTVGTVTASVTYGVNAITKAEGFDKTTAHGDFTVPAVATCNAAVTISATPDTGYELDSLTVTKVSGGTVAVTTDGNDGSFTMPDENVTVSAAFKKIDYTITVNSMANGTVTAAATAQMGDTVTLTVSPAAGYQLGALTVKDADNNDVTVTGNVFTMPADSVTVSAAFTAIDYTVTVAAPTNGTVTASKATANIGDAITLTVTPATGYQLESLTVKDGSNNTVTVTDNKFTMPAGSVTVSAAFKKINYTVTVNSAENGTVTADHSTANYGDAITLSSTPADGYALREVTVKDANGSAVTVTGGKFTMPASSVTVSATFDELETYTIFYRAAGTLDGVLCRLDDADTAGYNMTRSAKLGDVDCWAIQLEAVKGKTALSLSFSTDGGTTWSALTSTTVTDDIPSTLNDGEAAVVRGSAQAFIVSFVWGDLTADSNGGYVSAAGESSYYLVTGNTTSVSVAAPEKTGYTFLGWDDGKGGDLKQVSGGAVAISGISQSTIYAARWQRNTCTVTYDLAGGSGSASPVTVNSGGTVATPANPTQSGYAFAGWVVAENVTERVTGTERLLSAGSAFDFTRTTIINDLKLRAQWKHVHSYVCLPLDADLFDGAFADYYQYKDYLHIRICSDGDDYSVEAHSFDSSGKCACGATKPTPKVTLTKSIDGGAATTAQVPQNSVVCLTAPQASGTKQFAKWEYSADGTNWRTLTTNAYAAFVIPASLTVRAVYEEPKITVSVESFMYGENLAFRFDYSVPKGLTVVDGGLLSGNNYNLRYMDPKQMKGATGLADLMFWYIPTTEAPIHFVPATENAIEQCGKATVRTKMFREEAINIDGKSNLYFKKPAVLGRTGTAAVAFPNSMLDYYGGYYYAMGYVLVKGQDGSLAYYVTDPIWATRSEPTKSDTKTY